MKLMIMITGR